MPPTRLIHSPFYRPRPRAVKTEACPVCKVSAGMKCVSIEDGKERAPHVVTYPGGSTQKPPVRRCECGAVLARGMNLCGLCRS